MNIEPLFLSQIPGRKALAADWVLPIVSPPIRNGVAIIGEGKVEFAANHGKIKVDVELPSGHALMPAMVNAHTHLEFSELQQPFPAGETFADWIRQVVRWRKQREESPDRHLLAIETGEQESHNNGVSLIGNIDTRQTIESPANQISDVVCLKEFISLDPANDHKHLECAESFLHALPASHRGLSPHAPYSIHIDLVAKLAQLAKQHQTPIAMHLAETEEELQLLAESTGPLVDMLKDFGVWRPEAFSGERTIADYLRALSPAKRVLVIHGNYLNAEAIDFLAAADNTTVVYCPRTHRHFDHRRHPLPELLKRNIPVALGTDSRASNPDLCVLNEAREVWRQFAELDPHDILRMATVNGADALGRSLPAELVAIEVGKTNEPAAAVLGNSS